MDFLCPYHRGGEAEGHHEDVMQHQKQLPAQEAHHSGPCRARAALLVTFDLLLVPVAQEHGVDVVGEVRRGEEDVGVGQPVTEEERSALLFGLRRSRRCSQESQRNSQQTVRTSTFSAVYPNRSVTCR